MHYLPSRSVRDKAAYGAVDERHVHPLADGLLDRGRDAKGRLGRHAHVARLDQEHERVVQIERDAHKARIVDIARRRGQRHDRLHAARVLRNAQPKGHAKLSARIDVVVGRELNAARHQRHGAIGRAEAVHAELGVQRVAERGAAHHVHRSAVVGRCQ